MFTEKRRRGDDERIGAWPMCIHFAGVDGSGKSTQARRIRDLSEGFGVPVTSVWLRFPRLLSAPLLLYARLRGFSHTENIDGTRHGYWRFQDSWLLTRIYPWLLLADAWLYAVCLVYLPLLWGRRVICDRFVVDTLVDLMTGLDDDRLDEGLLGRCFLAILPARTCVIVMTVDRAAAIGRSAELATDRTWARRREIYLGIASRNGFAVVDAASSIDSTTSAVCGVLCHERELWPVCAEKADAE